MIIIYQKTDSEKSAYAKPKHNTAQTEEHNNQTKFFLFE